MLNTKRNLKKQNKNASKYYLVNTYICYIINGYKLEIVYVKIF